MAKAKSTGSRSKSKNKTSIEQLGGRIPPHNLDAERALLCSALIDPDGFGRVVDIVNEDSFYDRRHQLVFAAMSRMYATAIPIDALTVSDELQRTDDLEAVGGDPFLAGLTNEVATAAHCEQYASIVREKYTLRRLIQSSTNITINAYDVGDSEELLEEAMQELFEIQSNRERGGFKPLYDVFGVLHDYLDKQHKREGQLTGVPTGFSLLDQYTSGFQKGDLVIIAGRPSMGKTAFSLDLARKACINYNIPVGYFSLEMASMAIAMRLIAAEGGLNLHRLRSSRLKEHEFARMAEAFKRMDQANFFIDDTGSLGIMEMRARARRLKIQHNIGILFIDYLQLMKPPKADSREQEVAQISRALKGLARELEIPVVAMSPLSRAVEHRTGDHRHQLADLRDTGAIEQDADVVMFIYRPSLYKTEKDNEESEQDNTTEIILRKQRNGPTGTVELVFNPEFTRFESKASDSDSDMASQSSLDPSGGGDDGLPF